MPIATVLGNPDHFREIGSPVVEVLALSAGNLKEIISRYEPMAAKFLYFTAEGLCRKLLERAAASG